MSWWNAFFNAATGGPPRQARRISAVEAEQLLRGQSAAADRSRLTAVLASVAAPASIDNYPGRAAAVDAFIRARQEWPSTQSPAAPARGARHRPAARRASFDRSAKTGRLKLSICAAAMSIVGAGVVVATGHLPAPAQHSAHGLLTAVGLPVPDAPRASRESPASPSESSPAHTTPTPGGSSTAKVSPVLASLCQTYQSAKKPGKAMAAADLDRLAQAAGTTDNIDAFCTELLSQLSPTPTPTATTSPSTGSSTGPDGTQICHGNGKKACPTPSA